MKHSTYQKLYKAHLGVVDEKGLLESRKEESDPFYQNLIDLIVEKKSPAVSWDNKPFTTDFLSDSPRKRLDETFFAFVLRIAAVLKEESYIRTYQKPESHQAVVAWISILRSVLVTSLALLYNVRWTAESIVTQLEPAVLRIFSRGDASALRHLMNQLGVRLVQEEEPYPAEILFEKLNFLPVVQFSAFYWRFLHWMAEAVEAKKKDNDDMKLYRSEWRQLLKGPLYRTIRCGVCMMHFKSMLDEYETRLSDEESDLAELLFTMHNGTHASRRENFKFLQEPDYTKSQYAADAHFMRQALLEK